MSTATAKAIKKKRRKLLRKKVCRLCESRINFIDFKDVELLRKHQTEKGRILPRRITGTCFKHQKMLARAIKRARNLALVP
ncbi:MAG: 30S ribosomal protein S18 [Kiritimatiellaeota bacterium]|nr:30S ribosomal protein S18 [Kiritimatiellota bacterium]